LLVKVPYGKEELTAEIPDSVNIKFVTPSNQFVPVDDEIGEIRRALANPIESPSLGELAPSAKKVAIIISDHTRITPSGKVVPEVLNMLSRAGIKNEDITILIACGLHRPTTDEELIKILGKEILENIRIVINKADELESFVDLGTTSKGTPVQVNKYLAEADLSISIGCIEPHHLAGWTGGAKNVMPGVSSRKAILTHHAQTVLPDVKIGRIEGNPFREDMDEYAQIVGLTFILNMVVNLNGKIVKAFFGHPIKAHRKGVEEARELLGNNVLKNVCDIVVGTPGGFPRDVDLWQAEGKALARINNFVKDDGVVILVAKCDNGFGSDELATYLHDYSADELIEKISAQDFSIAGFKAYSLAKLMKRASLYIVGSNLTSESTPKLPIKYYSTLQEAFNRALESVKQDATVLVVPNCPSSIIELS